MLFLSCLLLALSDVNSNAFQKQTAVLEVEYSHLRMCFTQHLTDFSHQGSGLFKVGWLGSSQVNQP